MMNTKRLGWVYSKEDVDEWIENHKAELREIYDEWDKMPVQGSNVAMRRQASMALILEILGDAKDLRIEILGE